MRVGGLIGVATAVVAALAAAMLCLPPAAGAGGDVSSVTRVTCEPGAKLEISGAWKRSTRTARMWLNERAEVLGCVRVAGANAEVQLAAGPERISGDRFLCTYLIIRDSSWRSDQDLCHSPTSRSALTGADSIDPLALAMPPAAERAGELLAVVLAPLEAEVAPSNPRVPVSLARSTEAAQSLQLAVIPVPAAESCRGGIVVGSAGQATRPARFGLRSTVMLGDVGRPLRKTCEMLGLSDDPFAYLESGVSEILDLILSRPAFLFVGSRR